MFLKRVKLINWAQHGHLELNFQPGLTGIIGPNGCGKSNLIRAIQRMICQNIDRNIPDMIRWGTSLARLEADLKLGDVDVSISHKTAETTAAQYTIGDREENSITDGCQVLSDFVGASQTTLEEITFANQGEMGQVLFGRDAARKDFFQKLLGVDFAEKGRKALQTELGRLPMTDHSDDLEEEKKRVKELEENLAGMKESASEIEEALDREKLQSLSDYISTYEERKSRKEKLKSQLSELQKKIERNEHKLADLHLELDEIHKQVSQYDQYESTMRSLMESYESQQERIKAQKQLREELKENQSTLEDLLPEPDVDQMASKRKALSEELRGIQSKRTRVQKLLKVYEEGGGVCPYCLQELPSLPDDVDEDNLSRLQSEESAKANELADLEEKISGARSKITSIENLRTTCNRLSQRVSEGEEEAIPEEDYDDAKRVIETLEELYERAKKKDNKVKQLQPVQDDRLERREELEQELGTLDELSEERYNESKKKLEELRQQETKLDNIEGRIEECGKNLEQRRSQVEELKKSVQSEKRRKQYRSFLTSTRELLHRDNIPARAIKRAVSATNRWISDAVEDFRLDFSAWIDEQTFEPVFMNADSPAPQSHDALSGGQKTALAICFHIALWRALLPSCNLLVLDEPTYFLDEDRITSLLDLMETIRVWANETQSQLLVVTHEERLKAGMDQIIDLSQ